MESDRTMAVEPQSSPLAQPPRVSKTNWREKLTGGMSWYTLELALSTFGLLVTAGVINYSYFALINHWAGVDSPLAQRFMGEFALWIVAIMIVWVPFTLFFYLRARNHAINNPANEQRFMHKLIVGLFSFWVVVAIASIALSIVYALLRIVIGIDDDASDTLLRAVLPLVLSVMTTAGLFFAYTHHPKVRRKTFVIALGILSLAIMIALLTVSLSTIKGADRDQKTAEDLHSISMVINSYYSDKNRLPSDLSELSDLDAQTKKRLSRYDYKKEVGGKYQLCATFVTDTSKSSGYGSRSTYDSEYSTYADFSTHGTGEKCFKLTTSYSSLYDSSSYDSSSFDSSSDSSTY